MRIILQFCRVLDQKEIIRMNRQEMLVHLISINKLRLSEAEIFIAKKINVEYWEGVRFTAKMNLRELRYFNNIA